MKLAGLRRVSWKASLRNGDLRLRRGLCMMFCSRRRHTQGNRPIIQAYPKLSATHSAIRSGLSYTHAWDERRRAPSPICDQGKGMEEGAEHTRESTRGVPLGAAGLGLAAGAAGGVPFTAKPLPPPQ